MSTCMTVLGYPKMFDIVFGIFIGHVIYSYNIICGIQSSNYNNIIMISYNNIFPKSINIISISMLCVIPDIIITVYVLQYECVFG